MEKIMCKAKRNGWVGGQKNIAEYRHTGGDTDVEWDNIVEDRVGMGTKYFTASSSSRDNC